MTGKRLGYKRVSTIEQNTDRQLIDIELDKIFIDKASGKSTERTELHNLLEYVRDDDQVFVHSIDRLARNLKDLELLIQQFNEKGTSVSFVKENLTFSGQDEPMQNLMLQLIGAVAQFERAILLERQREGIEQAKKRGVYKGKKQSLSIEEINLLRKEYQSLPAVHGSKSKLAKKFGISRTTLWRYVNNFTNGTI